MAISVLVVEDDRNIAELLQMYLEKEGYAVTVAGDGGLGLTKFRAIKPDLVLLDVMMPVMDGWAVCKAIRAEGQTPVIMLTAKGDTIDRIQGLDKGADDYMVKPFDAKELVARIKQMLSFRRATSLCLDQQVQAKPSLCKISQEFLMFLSLFAMQHPLQKQVMLAKM